MTKPDKYLIVVNKNNTFNPEILNNFEFDEVRDTDGKTIVEKKTHEALVALNNHMIKKYGIALYNVSFLRTIETQQKVFDDYLKTHSFEETSNLVASPGTSEHHTGLAVDVHPNFAYPEPIQKIANKVHLPENVMYPKRPNKEQKDEMYANLHKELSEFGFILRYTKDKKDITGFNAERWHIRYVGKEHAKAIEKSGLCLEEYVQMLQSEHQGSQPGEE